MTKLVNENNIPKMEERKTLNDKFFSLEKEKKDKIINAALREFGMKGFHRASTNEIVKEAEISKGLLFHYFKNKKTLYIFLFDYAVEMISEKVFGDGRNLEEDVFQRFLQITIEKLNLFKQHPDLFDFLMKAMEDEAIQDELKNREIIEQAYQKVFSGIDFTRFKEGLNIEKALKVIYWTFQGFGEEEQERLKREGIRNYDIDQVTLKMKEYIQFLRHLFYK